MIYVQVTGAGRGFRTVVRGALRVLLERVVLQCVVVV